MSIVNATKIVSTVNKALGRAPSARELHDDAIKLAADFETTYQDALATARVYTEEVRKAFDARKSFDETSESLTAEALAERATLEAAFNAASANEQRANTVIARMETKRENLKRAVETRRAAWIADKLLVTMGQFVVVMERDAHKILDEVVNQFGENSRTLDGYSDLVTTLSVIRGAYDSFLPAFRQYLNPSN